MQIKDESIEQVDGFKYLGCNISSNMNCCQKVNQRMAMAKETFIRKRRIFCGPLEKELRKEEASGVWHCMVQRLGHYDGMSKMIGSI